MTTDEIREEKKIEDILFSSKISHLSNYLLPHHTQHLSSCLSFITSLLCYHLSYSQNHNDTFYLFYTSYLIFRLILLSYYLFSLQFALLTVRVNSRKITTVGLHT